MRESAKNPGGRPVGPLRYLISRHLSPPATCREIAGRTCIGLEATRTVLNNMVRHGEAVKLTPVRVPGVCRPVPVYAAPKAQPEDWPQSRAGEDLQQAWAKWWPSAETLAAARRQDDDGEDRCD